MGKEYLARSQEIQAWLDVLRQFSEEAAEGSLEAFYELKKAIAPDLEEEGEPKLDIKDLAGTIPPRTLATIYASQQLLKELWDNFGPYNSGFSSDSIPTVHKIGRTVGLFIQAGAFNPNGDKGNPLEILGQTVEAYLQLIAETEAKATVENGEGWLLL